MRLLVNGWSPLTHASHCMTTSKPAAATQMRVRVSPAMQPKVFCTPEALLAATLPIPGLKYWLRICWFAYPEARLLGF